ncbi:hypothetical protein MACK_004017 [Theileria orientalis]|uniref:Uncharacterized protein n=1 Tax=Theileria orientalis TaxID=68886 RepID=A0A976SJU5_THEOR|nr:hypothetical protein MACK_004017 [Theileria orientalis]
MEIFIEFLRVLSTSLNSRTTSLIKSSANHSRLLKFLVVKIGVCRHRTRVNLLLWNTLWRFRFLKRGFTDTTSRVEIFIKPIEDKVALDIGTEILAEFLLLTTMISTMFYSIYLRRTKYNAIVARQNAQEAKVLSRLDYIEQEISKLLNFKSTLKESEKKL